MQRELSAVADGTVHIPFLRDMVTGGICSSTEVNMGKKEKLGK